MCSSSVRNLCETGTYFPRIKLNSTPPFQASCSRNAGAIYRVGPGCPPVCLLSTIEDRSDSPVGWSECRGKLCQHHPQGGMSEESALRLRWYDLKLISKCP